MVQSLSPLTLLIPYYAVPERLNPVVDIDDDNPEEIIIRWSPSYGVLRYILEMRQFVADGPGKEKIKMIDGYPLELSGVVLGHTVTNLSKILNCQSLLQLTYLPLLTPTSLSLISLPVCLSACLSVSLSVCLSICLSVYLPFSLSCFLVQKERNRTSIHW